MVDTFVRDYLVERMESMLGATGCDHRAYYRAPGAGPRAALASKAATSCVLPEGSGTKLVAASDWLRALER